MHTATVPSRPLLVVQVLTTGQIETKKGVPLTVDEVVGALRVERGIDVVSIDLAGKVSSSGGAATNCPCVKNDAQTGKRLIALNCPTLVTSDFIIFLRTYLHASFT